MSSVHNAEPWYRHRWPWLLMAGPALVVIAGAVTTWLAVRSNDGLVADDYYKQGVAINQTLARDERAKAMGLAARVRVDAEHLSVFLQAAPDEAPPAQLKLTLSHPTRAGADQQLVLARQDNAYTSPLAPLSPGRWQLIVTDEAGAWRLTGSLRVPEDNETVIAPAETQLR